MVTNHEHTDISIPGPIHAGGIPTRKQLWKDAVDEYNKAALSEATLEVYTQAKDKAREQYQALMKVCRYVTDTSQAS